MIINDSTIKENVVWTRELNVMKKLLKKKTKKYQK